MVFDLSKINGIDEYITKQDKNRTIFFKGDKAFLVENKNTIEVRCDEKLSQVLQEDYESVMESRYFGRGGIEIVLAGNQLSLDELCDLVRLSYNLS
jgi:predicted DNA-binding protein (MmcQ/YjbR family)